MQFCILCEQISNDNYTVCMYLLCFIKIFSHPFLCKKYHNNCTALMYLELLIQQQNNKMTWLIQQHKTINASSVIIRTVQKIQTPQRLNNSNWKPKGELGSSWNSVTRFLHHIWPVRSLVSFSLQPSKWLFNRYLCMHLLM